MYRWIAGLAAGGEDEVPELVPESYGETDDEDEPTDAEGAGAFDKLLGGMRLGPLGLTPVAPAQTDEDEA